MKREFGYTQASLMGILACVCLLLVPGVEFLLGHFVFGTGAADWTNGQSVIFFCISALLCGLSALGISRLAEKRWDFRMWETGRKTEPWRWAVLAGAVAVSMLAGYIGWGGCKLMQDYEKLGLLCTGIKYIYYGFEMLLIAEIIVFVQILGENLLPAKNIPFAGLVLGLGWCLAFGREKGLLTGILCLLTGLAFGGAYLLMGRDLKKTWLALLLLFAL